MWSYVKWLQTPLRRRLGIRLLIDRNQDHRKTTFVAGTARSGTTWVSELINFQNDYRYIFEPFNPEKVAIVQAVGRRRYLRPTAHEPALRAIAEQVVTGKIRHPWTERFNRRFVVDQRLVKDIRANLLLKWLHTQFAGMPIVLILRHPCAVAHSYAKHGWHGSVDALLAQPTLVEDFIGPYVDVIRGAADAFERAVCIWCIETLVPLKQFTPEELHIVFYEELAQHPQVELERLFAFLRRPLDAAALAAVTRPSRTSRRDSAIARGENSATSWIGKVDDAHRRRASEIVRLFGLDGLYSASPMPNPAALRAIMGAQGGSGQALTPT